MKKRLFFEIVMPVLLVGVALAACVGIPQGAFAPGKPEATQSQPATGPTTEAATEPPTEPPTEPEPTAPQITWKQFPADRELTARQAFVYDCKKGEFTYLMGHPYDRVWPASITKLFSLYVAGQYLDPETELTVGEVLDRIPEDASTAKLERGDVLTVEMLMEGMLLPSGNDAAYLIATEAGRQIAGDPQLTIDQAVDAFVAEMNRQAEALKLTGTHFENPDGYHHENHYTNFRDLVAIGKLALELEVVQKYALVPKTVVTPVVGQDKEWINTNVLVNPETEYYCPYNLGLKTGQTDAAGSCLLSAFEVNGTRYIIGVFGSPLFDDKLDDTLDIFNKKVLGQ